MITESNIRKIFICIHVGSEIVAFLSALIDIPLPPDFLFSLVSYQKETSAKVLMQNFIAPFAFGPITFVPLAALLFNEANSRTVWFYMCYYHVLNVTVLSMYPKMITPDATPAILFHAILAGIG